MKPIDKLKELYYSYVNCDTYSHDRAKTRYYCAREFALDCGLVTFNEVELMEYEQND